MHYVFDIIFKINQIFALFPTLLINDHLHSIQALMTHIDQFIEALFYRASDDNPEVSSI